MKKHIIKIFIIAAALMTAGAAGASAFFTDMESYGSDTVKTGELLFSFPDDSKPEGGKDKDFSIVADLGDHGDRLTPYKEGEDIEISFRAYLGGDVPAIVVPRLEVITEGIGEDGLIRIFLTGEDGSEAELGTIKGTEGSSFFYGRPSVMEPDSEKVFKYRIHVEKLSDEQIPRIDFDFSIAASQLKSNEELVSGGASGEMVYEDIKEDHDGEESGINGFTSYTDLEDAVDENGEYIPDSALRKTVVRLTPNIIEPGSGGERIRWYKVHGADREIIEPGKDGALILMLGEKNIHYSFEYEISNEAGVIVSDPVSFIYEDGTVKQAR